MFRIQTISGDILTVSQSSNICPPQQKRSPLEAAKKDRIMARERMRRLRRKRKEEAMRRRSESALAMQLPTPTPSPGAPTRTDITVLIDSASISTTLATAHAAVPMAEPSKAEPADAPATPKQILAQPDSPDVSPQASEPPAYADWELAKIKCLVWLACNEPIVTILFAWLNTSCATTTAHTMTASYSSYQTRPLSLTDC
ncbi:uncharacterized protein V1510DRAFT_246718 [Dipodascopsis tothii]|uniref:uncharacterized protein n=1 Tax=Dipodascopsis tothii TaxID=44089 RepID=UPI0034CEB004